jgi:peptide/nickel transport system substrate-binding protein
MRPSSPWQGRFRPRGRMLAAGMGAAALALAAASCSSTSSAPSSGAPVNGGTAVMAELPSYTPDYIFPFTNSADASNANIFDLQWLLYRPLYWFGTGAQPTLNTSLSLASRRPSAAGRSRSR